MPSFSKKLKDKMGTRGARVVKLCLWAGILTWMVFWLAYGIIMAKQISVMVALYGAWKGPIGDALVYVAPIWVIFTVLLTDVLVARWVYRKLREPREEEEDDTDTR